MSTKTIIVGVVATIASCISIPNPASAGTARDCRIYVDEMKTFHIRRKSDPAGYSVRFAKSGLRTVRIFAVGENDTGVRVRLQKNGDYILDHEQWGSFVRRIPESDVDHHATYTVELAYFKTRFNPPFIEAAGGNLRANITYRLWGYIGGGVYTGCTVVVFIGAEDSRDDGDFNDVGVRFELVVN